MNYLGSERIAPLSQEEVQPWGQLHTKEHIHRKTVFKSPSPRLSNFFHPDLLGCRAQEIQAIVTENFISLLVAPGPGIDELCYLVLYGLIQRGPSIHKGEQL